MVENIKQRTDNISTKTFLQIYDMIMNLTLAPGLKISENSLAEQLGISRTPVREALIKLYHINLVDIQPQKNTIVSKININSVNNSLFLRRVVEENVLKEVIGAFSEAAAKKSYQIIEKQQETIKNGNALKNYKLDQRFHQLFFKIAKREELWDVVVDANRDYNRIRLLSLKLENKIELICSDHEAILDAVIKKQEDKAVNILRAHISMLKEHEEQNLLKKFPDYFIKK